MHGAFGHAADRPLGGAVARSKIVLSGQESGELERRINASTVAVRDRQRAEIVVLSGGDFAAPDRRACWRIARNGQPLVSAVSRQPSGRIGGRHRPRAQALRATRGGARGSG